VAELSAQEAYKGKSRKCEKDFTRKRKMTFTGIILYMLGAAKASTRNALERAFPQMKKENLTITQQAFSAARQKIKWEAIEELFRASAEGSCNEGLRLWRGYRVMAIDGTYLTLPSDAALLEHFGGLGDKCTSATALASLLYDLENDIILDAKIAPIKDGERSLADAHLAGLRGMESFRQGHRELVILDRGYPSHALVNSLPDKEIAFVIRVPRSFLSGEVAAGARDVEVALGRGKKGPRVRIVRLTLSTGEEETLMTNLPASDVEYDAFGELYDKRWGVETKYGKLKNKLETENFSGRLVDNIKQDFFSSMTVANMLATLVRQADRNVKESREGDGNKWEYKVNVNHAIGVYRDRILRVLVEDDIPTRRRLMAEMIGSMERCVVPIRPGREVPRKGRPRKARFHHNHKSNC
jgi:hypothetical protein